MSCWICVQTQWDVCVCVVCNRPFSITLTTGSHSKSNATALNHGNCSVGTMNLNCLMWLSVKSSSINVEWGLGAIKRLKGNRLRHSTSHHRWEVLDICISTSPPHWEHRRLCWSVSLDVLLVKPSPPFVSFLTCSTLTGRRMLMRSFCGVLFGPLHPCF